MADNVRLNEGVGGALMATDEVSIGGTSVQVPIVKISTGADGSHDNFVDDATPMPVSATQRTDALFNGATSLTPKFAIIDGASSGDNTIVAAVTGKKIRVLSLHVTMTGTLVTIRFEDGAAGTALTGQMTPLKGNSITLPYSPVGWFETTAATLLNMELGGAQSVDGCVVYVEV